MQDCVVEHAIWVVQHAKLAAGVPTVWDRIKTDHPHQVLSLTSQPLPSPAGASWDSATMTMVAAMSTTLILIQLEVAHGQAHSRTGQTI